MNLRAPAAMYASLALAGATPALSAQVVQGRVRLATDHAAAEASVILVDAAAGTVVAGALTDSAGRYNLRAPADGAYRVRARRIGFAPDSSAVLRLAEGAAATFDALLTPRALTLGTVVVREARRCVAPRDADSLTAGLWQEVQNALAGAIATTANARLGFTLRRFERQLDAAGATVVRSRTWEVRSVAAEPYVSISAESLATRGFVSAEGRDSVYAVPDARTLASDAFARTHCLRPTLDQARPAFIGLAFEPVGSERQGDVRGTLWVDRASSELRTLEYHYTGRRSGPRPEGRLEYRRVSSGAWIVGAWVVRVPVVASVVRSAPAAGERVGNTMRLREVTLQETVAVWEIGGDVGDLFDPDGARAPGTAARGVVRGHIVDSTSQQGVGRVLVELTPTQGAAAGERLGVRRSLTTVEGTFAFDSVPRGAYLLTAAAARFDTLNTGVLPIPLTVGPASPIVDVRITMAPATSGIASLCPAENPPGTTVLHGTVRDGGSGRPVEGARVAVQWLTGAGANRGGASATRHGRVAFTDSAGRYALCGLPADQRLVLNASAGVLRAPPIPLDPSPAPIRLRTISLERGSGANEP